MFRLLFVKLLLFVISGTTFTIKHRQCINHNPDVHCGGEGCKLSKGLVPIVPSLIFQLASPLFMAVLAKNEVTEQIDSVCYTYMELENPHKYILFRSTVYHKGTNVQLSNIEEEPSESGEISGGDPFCKYCDFALNQSCQDSILGYRCFTSGACNQHGTDVIRMPGRDAVYTAAVSPKTSEECKCQAADELAATARKLGLNAGPLVALPERLPYKCVTSFNGAPVINAYKVPPGEGVAVPSKLEELE